MTDLIVTFRDVLDALDRPLTARQIALKIAQGRDFGQVLWLVLARLDCGLKHGKIRRCGYAGWNPKFERIY